MARHPAITTGDKNCLLANPHPKKQASITSRAVITIPLGGRFISADNYPSTGQGLTGNNMFAYCGNNPVARKDSSGRFWTLIAKAAIGIAGQYVSDVIGNILCGNENVFMPTSSLGTYLAAGVTAMIPGTGFGTAILRNLVSESIVNFEREVLNEEVSIGKSLFNIVGGALFDSGLEYAAGIFDTAVENLIPNTYSSFAGKYRKIFPDATKSDIYARMNLETQALRRAKNCILFSVDSIANLIKPNSYSFV